MNYIIIQMLNVKNKKIKNKNDFSELKKKN